MSSGVSKWLATGGAVLALAVAMLLWGLAPASECSTAHRIHWLAGLPAFGLFVAAGGFVAARGSLAQRLLLFMASAAILAAYVAMLSASLPMVMQTEIGCAAAGLR